jgi:hypothetical protein
MSKLDLGKLKKTLKQKHSCGIPLQLRTRGDGIVVGEGRIRDSEYLYCPRCDEEIEKKHETRRMKKEIEE